MADAPFRDRSLSPEEVRGIVERAAALSKVGVAAGKSGRALTAAELERQLREIGIDQAIVQQAMAPPRARESPRPSNQIEREVVIEGALGAEHFEALAESIAAVMRMEGQVSAVGGKLSWTPGGPAREPSVTVHVKDGATRVRYLETRVAPAPAKVGFATLGSLAGATTGSIALLGAIPIAKAMAITAPEGTPGVFAIAALVGLGTAVASFVGLWRRYENVRAQREAFADEVVAHVAAAAPRSGTGSAKPSDGEWGPGESHSTGRGGAAPSGTAVRAWIDTPGRRARVESSDGELEVAEHELSARDRAEGRE